MKTELARRDSNKTKLLKALQRERVLTNHQARGIAGSRAMGRAWELKAELQAARDKNGDGPLLTIRHQSGSTWELWYGIVPQGPDSKTPTLHDSTRSQLSMF